MKRLALALALVCALSVVGEAMVPLGLQFTNGVTMHVSALPSATLNNMPTVTIMMWVKLTTVAPAAQRNFMGKSTVANRLVTFINSTTVSIQRGSSGTAPTATVTTTNLPALRANAPAFLVFSGDFGVTAPRIYAGSLTEPATEASAYSASTVGSTAGHDDSAANFVVGNGGTPGTTNTLPGVVYSVQVSSQVLSLSEIRAAQYRWNPRARRTVMAWRLGRNGSGLVSDESGFGNYGTNTAAIPVGEALPVVGLRRTP